MAFISCGLFCVVILEWSLLQQNEQKKNPKDVYRVFFILVLRNINI